MQPLDDRLERLKEAIDLPEKKKRIEILETEVSDPNLWNDQDKARKITQELADLKKEVNDDDLKVLIGFNNDHTLINKISSL